MTARFFTWNSARFLRARNCLLLSLILLGLDSLNSIEAVSASDSKQCADLLIRSQLSLATATPDHLSAESSIVSRFDYMKWTREDFKKARKNFFRFDFTHSRRPQEVLELEDLSAQEKVIVEEISKAGGKTQEIGMWIVTLHSGNNFTAPCFSHSSKKISNQALMDSLYSALSSRNISLAEIHSLQLFHTHPQGYPLSGDDERFLISLSTALTAESKYSTVHVYAVAFRDDLEHSAVFHFSR